MQGNTKPLHASNLKRKGVCPAKQKIMPAGVGICPTFLKKVDEFNMRNPENLLPFFPTAEPWTWSTGNINTSSLLNRPSSAPREPTGRLGKQCANPPREDSRHYDTYIPNLERWPGATDTDPALNREWWTDESERNPASSTQVTRPNNSNNTFTFIDNSSRNSNNGGAGPSNPRSYPNA